MSGRLLTAREVAELLAVSAETVLRWTRKGTLPAIRLPGGALRFRDKDLGAWLEERATPQARSVSSPVRERRPRSTLAVSAVPEGEEV